MGLRVVEKKSLRRWVILWLGELGRSRARRGSLVWGEVIGADLRCGVGEFRAGEAVALWSVSGAERAARGGSGEASVWGDSGGCSGRFELPRSTRKSRQPAARFAFSRRWCLLAVVCGSSRAEARTVTRILSLRREK